MSRNHPFLLKAACKDYLWGGRRLQDDYGVDTSVSPLAEAWVCSTHLDGCCVTEKGESLREVLASHPDFLGKYANKDGEIPILVKLIDAKKDLSVQVHPDDEYAMSFESGQKGKTELWYVLHADPGAKIVYGFSHDISNEQVRALLGSEEIVRHLQTIPVNKNDVFFVEPGIVHAIGAGCVIAEVQENSNLTYRLYDYDRVDKNGEKRQLHLDKAAAVMYRKSSAEPRQPMRMLNYRVGYASELLGRCKYFQVKRVLLNTERSRSMAAYKTRMDSFQVLLCLDGCGTIWGEDCQIPFFKGDCIFIPADSISLLLHGRAQLLDISC